MFWAAHLLIPKSEADTNKHTILQAPPKFQCLTQGLFLPAHLAGHQYPLFSGESAFQKTSWHSSQGCSVFLTFAAGRMFSDSGTQQLSIPDSKGIFLLKPHCQCHKNKWGSVTPCDPGGKIGWLCCHTAIHKGKMRMALATFVNSPSVVWMLKKSWLKVLFSSTGSSLGRLPEGEDPLPKCLARKAAHWCSVAEGVLSSLCTQCFQQVKMLFAPQNTQYRYPCNFFLPILLHSLNFTNMTLSLTFIFKWFLSSLIQGQLQLCSLALVEQTVHRAGQAGDSSARTGLFTDQEHTDCPGRQIARDISHHSPLPKSRCAKSWNHNLSSWK